MSRRGPFGRRSALFGAAAIGLVLLLPLSTAAQWEEWSAPWRLHRLPDGFPASRAVACSHDAAFVRGSDGRVARSSGDAWVTVTPAIRGDASGDTLWTSGAGDVLFATTQHAILRWNGDAWEHHEARFGGVMPGAVISFDGVGAYSVGVGRIIAWDGQRYANYDGGTWRTLTAIWGVRDNDLWVGGVHGVVRHFDGARLSRRDLPRPVRVTQLWGTSSSDVWALTETEPTQIYHWDGQAWRSRRAGLGRRRVVALGGAGEELYALGPTGVLRWSGRRWENVVRRERVVGPSGRAAADRSSGGATYAGACATRTHVFVVERAWRIVWVRPRPGTQAESRRVSAFSDEELAVLASRE